MFVCILFATASIRNDYASTTMQSTYTCTHTINYLCVCEKTLYICRIDYDAYVDFLFIILHIQHAMVILSNALMEGKTIAVTFKSKRRFNFFQAFKKIIEIKSKLSLCKTIISNLIGQNTYQASEASECKLEEFLRKSVKKSSSCSHYRHFFIFQQAT